MKTKGVEGVKENLANLEVQLLNTVALVRERLSKLQSLTLGALIVIDVHAKDVIRKLVEDRVEEPNHFNWISQLRYYWTDDNCFVRCI